MEKKWSDILREAAAKHKDLKELNCLADILDIAETPIFEGKKWARFSIFWQQDKEGNPVLRFNHMCYKLQQLKDRVIFHTK